MGNNVWLRWAGSTPLAAFPVLATRDPEVALAGATELLGPHRMAFPSGRFGFAAGVNAFRWREMMLAYFTYGVDLTVVSPPLNSFYAVNLSLHGHAEVRHRGVRWQTGPGTAVVFSPADDSSMRWSADHEVLCLTIGGSALERHLSRMLGREITGPIAFAPEVSRDGAAPCWTGVTQMLLDVADQQQTGAMLAGELASVVMTTLLLSQPHSYRAELLADRPPASARTVRLAVDLMHATQTADLTVAAVAEQVGVSERVLQLAFRRRLGIPPSRYLRDLRLDRVREELLRGAGRSVARVAVRHGFAHLGRFSALYRARFAEYPSQTVRRSDIDPERAAEG